MTTIPINISADLEAALIRDGKDPKNYGPAYNGESVAIDLYNASPSALVLPPLEQATPGEYDNGTPLLWSYTKRLMPAGLRVALPPNWGAFVFGRGSITKTPLIHRAGVIDPGYTDEVFVNIINLGPEIYRLEPLAKSPFQLVFMPVSTDIQIVTASEFATLTASAVRKEGKIGSSD